MSEQLAVNLGDAFKFCQRGVCLGISNKPGYQSIGDFISRILPNVYVVASVILFILLIFGGFVIITSAGNPDKQAEGGKAITAAVSGFALIFLSYWIIQIIEYMTGIKILNPGV